MLPRYIQALSVLILYSTVDSYLPTASTNLQAIRLRSFWCRAHGGFLAEWSHTSEVRICMVSDLYFNIFMQFRTKEFCSSQLEYTQLLPAVLFLDDYFWHVTVFLGLNMTNQRAKYICLTCKFNLTEVTLLVISHGFDFPGWYTKRHKF